MNTNTPAALAGLAQGDLILEADGRPPTQLKHFRQMIDRLDPGTLLPVKAWRDGKTLECNVRVGRETFTYNGMVAIALPGFFHEFRLWPRGGFSVGVLGYETESVSDRKELNSVEVRYFKTYDPKHYQVTDDGWRVWAVVLQASTSKTIRSQEVTPAQTSSLEKREPGAD